MYRRLLEAAAEDIEGGGPVGSLFEDWEGDPDRGYVGFRLLAGVHYCVLAGQARGLACYYPSVGGVPEWPATWHAFRLVISEQAPLIKEFLKLPPQTNDVRRVAAMLGGFLKVASVTGLPLALREIGTSAGLNLNWDRYRYKLGEYIWGQASSKLRLVAGWDGPAAPFDAPVEIRSRLGCDISPIDVRSDDAALRLRSYVWAEEVQRLRTLEAAIAIARAHPVGIEQQSAADWVEFQLQTRESSSTLVFFHSSVWAYLAKGERTRLRQLLHSAGQRASHESPIAWLSLEDRPDLSCKNLRLRLWPGDDCVLATVHQRTHAITWLGEASV
jgi:hypothetical protein